MGLMAAHFDKRGFYESGQGGVESRDEIILEQEGETTVGGAADYTYSTLARIDKEGKLVWITTLDSRGAMEMTDLVVDRSAGAVRVWVSGAVRGREPRFYLPDAKSRKTRRGPAYGEGVACDAALLNGTEPNVTEKGACWYIKGDANAMASPIDASPGEPNKWGVFLAAYDASGVPFTTFGGIYFRSMASQLDHRSVRIAAHTTLSNSRPPLGSAFTKGGEGLYLAFRLIVSKFGDTIYFGEQAQGSGGVGVCVNGDLVKSADGNVTCVGGKQVARDAMMVKFEQVLPTPDLNPTYVALVKLIVGAGDKVGSNWVRLLGDIGAGEFGSLAGIAADGDAVYLTGTNTYALRSLSFQNCTFGEVPPECLEDGAQFVPMGLRAKGESSCRVQRHVRVAPNQV